ncbi:hypothetical protein M752DRAFT_335973 [Aspergillus phoenicis ATCC 13157]|uniref:Uncharacterized protein n=1 Tax=Aspergillus phoenicis ATCC 13157 TaxID=1353007 RepID=A0A370PJR1_ASPPH|nr:hypothetical protein M752DRAFT_335973 [Aspergillus phoenicis ATCC 13157]
MTLISFTSNTSSPHVAMDINLTRRVANWQLEACRQAEAKGRTILKLEDFSDNPELKQAATLLLKNLQGSQNKVDRVAITEIEPIALVPEVNAHLADWKHSPHTFGSGAVSESLEVSTTEAYPVKCFLARCKAEEEIIINQVYSRFWEVIFHRFHDKSREEIGASADTDLFGDISRSLKQFGSLSSWEEGDIQSRLRSWVRHGERYDRLIKDLGGEGTLLLLPFKGESFWVERVPKTDTSGRRNDLIASLLKRGFKEVIKRNCLNDIALKVIDYHVNSLVSWFKGVYLSNTRGNPRKRGRPRKEQGDKIGKRKKEKKQNRRHLIWGEEEARMHGSAHLYHSSEGLHSPQSMAQPRPQGLTCDQFSNDMERYTVNQQTNLPSSFPHQDSQQTLLQHQNLNPYEHLELQHRHAVTHITPDSAETEGHNPPCIALHDLFQTQLEYPNDISEPALPGIQSGGSSVSLHDLFHTQLEYPSTVSHTAFLSMQDNSSSASLHDLFQTRLEYPSGISEPVLPGAQSDSSGVSLHNPFQTQLEYCSGMPELTQLGAQGNGSSLST